MADFQHYWDPKIPLKQRLMDLSPIQRGKKFEQAMTFLAPLEIKDFASYEHSIRVALLARQIGEFIHLNDVPLLYSGLLHDLGKLGTRLETLQKTDGWTEADSQEMEAHVMDGYRLIRGCFDFSAEIILWHHRFQPRQYPKEMPPSLHDYSQGTKILIPMFGRMLSLADTFDAMHRVNDKYKSELLSGEKIRERMLSFNRDQEILVRDLFEAGIFTTAIMAA